MGVVIEIVTKYPGGPLESGELILLRVIQHPVGFWAGSCNSTGYRIIPASYRHNAGLFGPGNAHFRPAASVLGNLTAKKANESDTTIRSSYIIQQFYCTVL
jgi:hypothetical protein